MRVSDENPDFVALYRGEEFIGDLVRKNGNIRFEPNPLAKLPSGDMVNFIENLLPEGERARWYEALRHLPENDMVGYLQTFGEDLAGSLTNGPASPTSSDEGLFDATRRIAALLEEGAPLDATIKTQKSLLAGADPKIAVIWKNSRLLMPDADHPSTHILKCGNGLCLNERFCMELLSRCGIRTAKTSLLCLGGKEALLVERFDRKDGKRLMSADFCQILGVGSGEKYRVRWEDIGKIIRDFPREDREQLLKSAFFNIILGCSDDHAKNISAIIEDGGMRLAPMYDVASMSVAKAASQRYRHLDTGMAKTVGGQSDRRAIKPTHLRMLGKILDVGNPETAFAGMLAEIGKHAFPTLDKIAREAEGLPFDAGAKAMHARFLEQMEKSLEKELRFFKRLAMDAIAKPRAGGCHA